MYTSEHSRFVSGMTEERSYRPDSWSQSELYDFIGCVTIKGLSFLDIIHNIDCYVVFDGQTTVLELRKTEDDRTRRSYDCSYLPCRIRRLDHDRWTLRDGDEPYWTTNWICLVVFAGHTITRRCRKTSDNLTLDDCSLAPLPLVCGGQATTFGFRQMEDDSSWRLISRFCCLSLKMEVKDKSLLLFTKWFMALLSLQKFSDLDFS